MEYGISSWLQENTRRLQDTGIISARLDCLILLENVLGKDRAWIAAHGDEPITDEHVQKLDTFITQRLKRIPLAYILAAKEFYGREFLVNEDVLIPRPESEAMISLLLNLIKTGDRGSRIEESVTIIDVGTGSGCLAIIAKLEVPRATVIATDISKKALEVAQKNARNLGADITFLQSDLLSKIQDLRSKILLANLPYVPDNLITSEEITKEPAAALFSGTDGLDHYRKFWQQVTTLESRPSYIITESLEDQHAVVAKQANQAGYSLRKTIGLAQLFADSGA